MAGNNGRVYLTSCETVFNQLDAIGGLQSISRDTNNNSETNKIGGQTKTANERMIVYVHQHGGDDVTCKQPIDISEQTLTEVRNNRDCKHNIYGKWQKVTLTLLTFALLLK